MAKRKYTHEFTVKRSWWTRATTEWEASYLYNPNDRKMCCVGFYLKSLGCPVRNFRLKGTTDELEKVPVEAEWMVKKGPFGGSYPTHFANVIYSENDATGNEIAIAKLFSKRGIKVNFVP